MRYKYWIHLRDSEQLSSCIFSSYVSKTRLHKAIDFYSKHYLIEQILIQPDDIQNPRPVGDETDNIKEFNKCTT